MRRTQIYLSDEQGRWLQNRSRVSGKTMSELVRTAIDLMYARPKALTAAQKIRIANRTAGAWNDYPESGATFVERVRGSRRLARLHRPD